MFFPLSHWGRGLRFTLKRFDLKGEGKEQKGVKWQIISASKSAA